MRKHLTTIIIIVMFIVGLSVLLYPAISNYINQKNASKVIGTMMTDILGKELTPWENANPAKAYMTECVRV